MRRLRSSAGFFAAAGGGIRPRLRARVLLPALLVAFALVPVASAAAAEFEVQLDGGGTGTVTGTLVSGGAQVIDCSNTVGLPAGPTCSATVSAGTSGAVEFTATPGPLFDLIGWTVTGSTLANTCSGQENPCRVTPLLSKVTVAADFETLAPAPEVEFPASGIEPVQAISSTGATLHGAVNPRESLLAACRFEAVPQAEPQGFASPATKKLPCSPGPGAIGEGNGFIPVEATAGGLEPNTAYRVRLIAEKENSAPRSVTAEASSFTTETTAPDLTTEAAWSISDTTATLTATVNAHNSALADCHFAYGLAAEGYPDTAPCAFENSKGEASVDPGEFPLGNAAHQVTAEIAGLRPESAYHFRIVADNGTGGPQEGRDATFTTRTLTETALPERGYELVSAADTNGLPAGPDFASPDGEDYAYTTFVPVPGAVDAELSYFRASRSADGSWAQQAIGVPPPPAGRSIGPAVAPLYSSNISIAAFRNRQNVDPDDAGSEADWDVYRQDLDTNALTWLSRSPEIPAGEPQTGSGNAEPVYISPDGKRVLFESERRLLSTDIRSLGARRSLYQWEEGGRLSLVGRVPSSGASCDDASAPVCVGSASGSELGSDPELPTGVTYGAVSADGSRVVFQAGFGSGAPPAKRRLYLRLDGERTVEASASAPGVSPPATEPWNVNFWGADAEDEDVFFTSSSALTVNSEATDTEKGAADLYDYEVGTEALMDLTPSPGGAGVKRVYDVSEDARRVYFTSTKRLDQAGQLTEAAQPGETLQGAPGGPNLYLAERAGDVYQLSFIATVNDPQGLSEGLNSTYRNQTLREIAANPDGSVLAFRSTTPLVPGRQTAGLAQVYVYEAPRGELICASCPPDGTAPTGEGHLTASVVTNGKVGPVAIEINATNGIHPRNVSTDGAVFFQTGTPLLPADTNGKIDVYEFRGGSTALISTGTSVQDSLFAGASRNGSTVFFSSGSGLAGGEAGVIDIYAARVGGGYIPPTPTPPCSGEDCEGPSSAAPVFGTPSSTTFSGFGNAIAPPHTTAMAKSKKKTASQIKAGKLAKALKACAKKKSKKKRAACESAARKRFRSKARSKSHKKAKSKSHRGGR